MNHIIENRGYSNILWLAPFPPFVDSQSAQKIHGSSISAPQPFQTEAMRAGLSPTWTRLPHPILRMPIVRTFSAIAAASPCMNDAGRIPHRLPCTIPLRLTSPPFSPKSYIDSYKQAHGAQCTLSGLRRTDSSPSAATPPHHSLILYHRKAPLVNTRFPPMLRACHAKLTINDALTLTI